jgi:ubiquinone/menaquinone biosynthesis C-methylase UbiE
MASSKDEREHWDQIAQSYDEEHRRFMSEAFERQVRAWLERQFTPDDKVLELGCGTGIFAAMIAGQVGRVTATDLSGEMLKRAAQRLGEYENVEVRQEDACRTSFADDSFSAVLAVNLLHHAHEPKAVLRECRRVLTPGGRLVVIDCIGHGRSLWAWIRASLGRLCRRGQPQEEHRHFSAEELVALITEAGLTVGETTLIHQRRPRAGFLCLRAMNPG